MTMMNAGTLSGLLDHDLGTGDHCIDIIIIISARYHSLLVIRLLFVCNTFCASLIHLFPAIWMISSTQRAFGRPWFLWPNLGQHSTKNYRPVPAPVLCQTTESLNHVSGPSFPFGSIDIAQSVESPDFHKNNTYQFVTYKKTTHPKGTLTNDIPRVSPFGLAMPME